MKKYELDADNKNNIRSTLENEYHLFPINEALTFIGNRIQLEENK